MFHIWRPSPPPATRRRAMPWWLGTHLTWNKQTNRDSIGTILLEKLILTQLSKKFSALYGTLKFITVFSRNRHWSIFWARRIQYPPSQPISLRSILISCHLVLALPSGLFPSDFPSKILHAFLISAMRATYPARLILHNLSTVIMFGEEWKLWNSSLCSLLYSPSTCSLLGRNILLSTLFSNSRSLCSSLRVRDQVSHPNVDEMNMS